MDVSTTMRAIEQSLKRALQEPQGQRSSAPLVPPPPSPPHSPLTSLSPVSLAPLWTTATRVSKRLYLLTVLL